MLQKQFSEIESSSAVVAVREEETPAIPATVPVPLPIEAETLPIDRLLRGLKHRRFLHSCFGSLTGDTALSRRAVRFLLETLEHFSDRRWRERTIAAWALGNQAIPPEMEQEVVEALSEVLRNTDASLLVPSRAWRWFERSFLVCWLGILLFSLVHGTFLGSAEEIWRYLREGDLFGIGIIWLGGGAAFSFFTAALTLPITFPLGLPFDTRRADNVRIAAATALGRLGKPESIGVLAKALFDRNSKVREAAESAFRAVLPTLTPAHYGRLGADAVANLCRALHYQETQLLGFPADQERLIFRILEALEKVGDGNAVEAVRQIAATGLTLRIQEEAIRILPILLARQRRENEPKILLRATTMPADLSAQLLRPATPSEADPPEQLLRPMH